MRIARLELHGFKSFADRTVFHFGPGISCVVGPNGCGKSNVVDALKWVIGEMSARTLRGEDMLDVIFAGSAERKPVGFAEAGLTLTAEGGEPFPGEYARYAEIQIARRLYRDGSSEYLINQTRCRRKDIVDLIMDSGIGNHLYSFIEQGRIDKIVSASPEERRSLIDEAAGITRYKLRRAEARQKLEATSTQLDRAADVADEMGRRLGQLERQVLKAARFRRLRALVRQEEVFLALVKLRDLQGSVEEVGGRLGDLRRSVAEDEVKIAGFEANLSERKGLAEVTAAAVVSARDALAEVDAHRREVDATRVMVERRRDELSVQLDALHREVDAERVRGEEARVLAALAEEGLAEVEASIARVTGDVERSRSAESDAGSALSMARDAMATAERDAAQAEADRREVAVRHEGLTSRAAALPGQQARLEERTSALADELVVVAKRLSVAEGAAAERAAQLAAIDARRMEKQAALDEAVKRDLHARDAVRRSEIEVDAAQKALSEAVGQAEAAAGRAEAEVAAEVSAVQKIEEGKLRDTERGDLAKIASAEAAERGVVADAASRGRAWTEAAQKAADREHEAWRAAAEQSVEADDAARQRAIDEAVAAAAAAVEAVEEAERTGTAAKVGAAREKRTEAERQAEAAREAQGQADARLAQTTKELREVEGRIAALRAQEEGAKARDAGSTAVARALPAAPRLLDALPETERAEAARLLGGRVLLPVVRDGTELASAAKAATSAGAASVVLVGGEVSLQGLLRGTAVVEDLASAAAHHLGGGGAAVVRGSGERIDLDGVVSLGRSGKEAEAAVARRTELEGLEVRRQQLDATAGGLRTEVTTARARLEGAQIASRKAAELADALEKEGRERLRVKVGEARASGDAEVKRLRDARAAWRSGVRAGVDREAAARQATQRQALAELRTTVDRHLEELRKAGEARVAEQRATLAAAREGLRGAADEVIAAAREAAWERVRRTTADVAVRRDHLRGEVEKASRALASARQRGQDVTTALTDARAGVEAVVRERSEVERVITRLEAEAEGARQQQASLTERRVMAVEELDRVVAERAEVQRGVAEVSARLGVLSTRAGDARGTRDERQAALVAVEQAHRAAQVAKVDAERKLAGLRERRVQLDAERAAASRQQGDAEVRVIAGTERLGSLAGLRDESEVELVGLSGQLDRLSSTRQEAAVTLDAARARDVENQRALTELQSGLREGSIRLERARRSLLDAEAAVQRGSSEREALLRRIEERYQVDLPDALARLLRNSGLKIDVPDEARAGLEIAGKVVEPVEELVVRPEMLEDEPTVRRFVAEIEVHREELSKLGDVNLGALEEYLELKTRHDDLEGQRQDLDASVAAIRAAIAKMNKTCRERFRETYDRVNEAFRTAYPELVGGGEARLELTDEEDLLETGVEIYVRPPGKRLQTLSLLSGGEKAMTAIALLLALFTVKPSPFCVLDEVDAPLDEANGARFNDMLRQMAKMTQFIVITHNRKTMECADTLYGITMPTPGCSSLVSVKVD